MTQIVHAPAGMSPKASKEYFGVLSRYQKMKDAGRETGTRVVRTVASFATGAVLGYLDGRYDYAEIHGVPTSAAVAVGSNIAGLFLGGSYGEMLHNIGNAAGAVYGRDWAADLGRTAKQKAGQNGGASSSTTPAGYTPYSRA